MKLKTAYAQGEPDDFDATLISWVCNAIVDAYKRRFPGQDIDGIRCIFDPTTGEIGIFASKTVVVAVSNDYREISLTDAQALIPDITLGETIEVELTAPDFSEFGRIAAQTANQLMTQRLRAEKELIRKEFEARKGTCTTGQIERIEVISNTRNNVIVNLGRVEGCVPTREQLPGETYRVGNRVRVYVLELRETGRVPHIIVSQAHPELVRELFELYVPEIEDGTVEIKSIAREAGYRTKIAVHSHDSAVDPVSACIGAHSLRIQNVVAELRNEKIDVIRYSSDPVDYISNALNPVGITSVSLYEGSAEKEDRRAEVVVPNDKLSLAIGPDGRNVRLAAKLTDWKIIIKSQCQHPG